MGFSSLYYTDCRPGEGLRGGAGFQFQAVSAGVGHEEMTLVQRSALYEAPVAWMRERRPVSDYPPSLTHVFDGFYATARGVYLGTEANGVREGNQFTHAVTTADPDAYGQVRPAQLWDAAWWSERPADSTECEPVPAEPEQGPWSRDAVREWLLGRPAAGEWLVAVCSAFERVHGPDGRRVLFVAAEAGDVLGWIAAGTLLMPQSRALRLSFRVFATNTQYNRHDVLALHPEWAGAHAGAARQEFVVFNLDTGERPQVEPTEAALFWAPRFLRGDPYDVVDAVEWAHQCASARDAEETRADRIAGAVVALGEPVEDAEAAGELARWLAEQRVESVEDCAEELVAAALPHVGDARSLRALDMSAFVHGISDESAAGVRTALLAAEVREVGDGDGSVGGPLPGRSSWGADEWTRMTEVVERALDAAAPEHVDELMLLAARFGVRPRTRSFPDGARRFAAWWVDNPDRHVDLDRWPTSEDVLHRLRDELTAALTGGRAARVAGDVRTRWWPLLWQSILDPRTPLDSALASAAVAEGGPKVRIGVLHLVLDRTDDAGVAWRALFTHSRPTPGEILLVLEKLPVVPAEFAATVRAEVAESSATALTLAHLDVLAALGKHHHGGKPDRLTTWSEEDRRVRAWLQAPSARDAKRLRPVSRQVLGVHKRSITRALLGRLPVGEVQGVLAAADDGVASFLADELAAALAADAGARARVIVLAYLAASSPACGDAAALLLERRLLGWIGGASGQELAEATRLFDGIGGETARQWAEFQAHALARKASPAHRPVASTGAPRPETGRGWWGRRRTRG
ncbi:GTPase-associated protein 1-related protein [Actinosynnema sp. NPDC059797]